ncbi:SigE family RNA polymerase sigma factor [Micromonospora sp. NPDC048909]|uniref:SigE family RNA polymerase sigma factor n=1 Tax=Micromonospora sp. NPDC048909 TaxID=3155643 RepID=UPI0033EAF56F
MGNRDPLEEEFREFVAARSGALLRTAYLLTADWATAEDLLQTALTKTYLAWKRLGGIEAIEPYARRVMVNTSTSWWRRRWHGERPTEVLPERAAADEIEQQLDRDVLWRHLSALPTRQRAVLVLRYYEDMSEAQTAALLDISPGTVKSQTSRALATLRKRMGAEAAQELAVEPSAAPARPSRGLRPAAPRPPSARPDARSPEPAVSAAGSAPATASDAIPRQATAAAPDRGDQAAAGDAPAADRARRVPPGGPVDDVPVPAVAFAAPVSGVPAGSARGKQR